MTEFETAQVAAQLTAAFIAAKATVAAAMVVPGMTHVSMDGVAPADIATIYHEVLAGITQVPPPRREPQR